MVTVAPDQPLRILHLEDSPADHALAALTLRRSGCFCDIHPVDSLPEFQRLTSSQPFDVILARQKALGGSDLAKTAGGATPGRDALAGARLEFLRRFYAYAQAHPGGQGQTFGAWLAGGGQP